MSLEKFSKGESFEIFRYSNIYETQHTEKFSRLIIAPDGNHIEIIKRLTEKMPAPFGILYLLLVPRGGESKEGRYQCPNPVSNREVRLFLDEFKDYFEQDGRHTIWIQCLTSNELVVYDKHNVIYAYGNIESYKTEMKFLKLEKGSIHIPVPHAHHYHPEFDKDEQKIISYWNWKRFPLQESDYE